MSILPTLIVFGSVFFIMVFVIQLNINWQKNRLDRLEALAGKQNWEFKRRCDGAAVNVVLRGTLLYRQNSTVAFASMNGERNGVYFHALIYPVPGGKGDVWQTVFCLTLDNPMPVFSRGYDRSSGLAGEPVWRKVEKDSLSNFFRPMVYLPSDATGDEFSPELLKVLSGFKSWCVESCAGRVVFYRPAVKVEANAFLATMDKCIVMLKQLESVALKKAFVVNLK